MNKKVSQSLSSYPRNMTGYGKDSVHPNWPNKARVAVQFVLNYEAVVKMVEISCSFFSKQMQENFTEELLSISKTTENALGILIKQGQLSCPYMMQSQLEAIWALCEPSACLLSQNQQLIGQLIKLLVETIKSEIQGKSAMYMKKAASKVFKRTCRLLGPHLSANFNQIGDFVQELILSLHTNGDVRFVIVIIIYRLSKQITNRKY